MSMLPVDPRFMPRVPGPFPSKFGSMLGDIAAGMDLSVAPLPSQASGASPIPAPVPRPMSASPTTGGIASTSNVGGEPISPLTDTAPAKPRISKGRLIAGILADAFAGALGQPGRVAQMWAKEREQEQERTEWHRRRQAQREDYEYQKRVDQRYRTPEEDQFTRMLRASGLDPASPAGQAMYRQKIESDIDPIVNVPLGEGRFFSGPKSQLAAAMMGAVPPSNPERPAIGAVVADPRVQGGAGLQAPRPFPR